MISPWPQFHTPMGTEWSETPHTSSTGSHPIEWRVTPRRSTGPRSSSRPPKAVGPGRPGTAAAASISWRMSTASATGGRRRAGQAVSSREPHRGSGDRHRVERLEPADPVAPQDALELRRPPGRARARWCSSPHRAGIAAQLAPDVLAGEAADGHLGLGRLLDLGPRRLASPHRAGPLGQVLGDAVGPHPHRGHRGGDGHRGVARPRPAWPGAGRPDRSSTGARRPAAGRP